MRFPFMFMALVSVVVAAWIAVYLGTSRLTDPVARGIAVASIAIFVALAGYQFYRRAAHGRES